ncbi:hypothetical protein N7457_006326 [Penicillium paradoxum]|uniref:uncharacterized protein n=1 Tax=Penicillium paradoxum TaxID=176176 RepID=UPI002547ADCC|nr:uncharacterized protein N7457_006326 [Penicillium paradoxum]KAJ5781166.1 hypothetical protein N7457_006326 [Penicillium paradoxum]
MHLEAHFTKMNPIPVRPPKVYTSEVDQCPPTNDFIIGTWHVTHSSLPLWKGKRNVNITYKLLPADAAGIQKIDDLVQYQAIDSEKIKSVHGVDTPAPDNPGAWDWRGRGWLMIASSHWECLGFGDVDDNQWVVTYFAKTLFTPAGIDVYSRNKEGLSQTTVDQILNALKELGIKDITDLVNGIFEIPQN